MNQICCKSSSGPTCRAGRRVITADLSACACVAFLPEPRFGVKPWSSNHVRVAIYGTAVSGTSSFFPVLRENEGAAGLWKRDGSVPQDAVNYIWALPASSIGCLEPTHIAPITALQPRTAPVSTSSDVTANFATNVRPRAAVRFP